MPFNLGKRLIIGIDFDNTLIRYDSLFYKLAAQKEFISGEFPKDKTAIRDFVRALPDGETKWQRLQALAYGPEIEDAFLPEGLVDFFGFCKEKGIKIYIVSHKTKFASQSISRDNLRKCALGWMERRGFFDSDGFGISRNNVFFESTREKKIMRIVQLKCGHFIDDLEEIFLEPKFPGNTGKILYAPQGTIISAPGLVILKSWNAIKDYFSSE
ncbi:conserved hypothetical protein [Candidatus Desulfarcum epimagneticum]|uniref:Haloacid dehalogenase-like hydrolase n=1 Tax=uncultured Desulfobacteraceae bacterium TaxID=218296 RepID=A0A484HJ74_9BACT|nr:conserved hypothetical protein [uncultured Desulfobacteraceae bacterium]